MSWLVQAPETGIPNAYGLYPSVFLAGGITGCPDWQKQAINLLDDADVLIFNPRQAAFDVSNPEAAKDQITWEHKALRAADAVLFWFCKQTIQPIVLYELGCWTAQIQKPIFVGVHPEYERKPDVVIQTGLLRPELPILDTLPSLCETVRSWAVGVMGGRPDPDEQEEQP